MKNTDIKIIHPNPITLAKNKRSPATLGKYRCLNLIIINTAVNKNSIRIEYNNILLKFICFFIQ